MRIRGDVGRRRPLNPGVIFRELLLKDLTLLDLKEGGQIALTLSHVAARQEVRDMVRALGLADMQ